MATNAEGDASIRVHIHRLRRKLEEFYAGAGATEPDRVTIPRGGYRLTIEAMPRTAAVPAPPAPVAVFDSKRYAIVVSLCLFLMLSAGLAGWLIGRWPARLDAALTTARASELWKPILSNGRRTAIVAGDYYMYGEQNGSGDVVRLVRKFDVNSPQDLERAIQRAPDRADTDVDLGLTYLPVGTANALRVVVPIALSNDHERLSTLVWPASQLSPEMLKLNNLIYVGYLSGLASLRDPVFNGSRFAIGSSYDEIVDRHTGRSYIAGTHLDQTGPNPQQDYALISSFAGVSGNRILVIAGTRDAALMQAADFATQPGSLTQLTHALNPGQAFDALLSIESVRNVGLRAHLLVIAPRTRDVDWSGNHAQTFPDDSATP